MQDPAPPDNQAVPRGSWSRRTVRAIRRFLRPVRAFYDRKIATFDLIDAARAAYLRVFKGYHRLTDHAHIITWGRFCNFVGRHDGRKAVLKIPSHRYRAGRELRHKLKDPAEMLRYRQVLGSLSRYPVLNGHICRLLQVRPDGGYVCEYIEGPNLLVLQCEIEAGTSPLRDNRAKAARILAAVDRLVPLMEEYGRRYGYFSGDWIPGNLIYDVSRDQVINVDLEGFYTVGHKLADGRNGVEFVMGRMRRVQRALRSLCEPASR